MNLKYYLRGLGIGIIVTAVIMGIAAGRNKESLSDAEIKERAKELGMVEQSGVLSELEGGTEAEAGSPLKTKTPAEDTAASPAAAQATLPAKEAALPSATPKASAEPKESTAPKASEMPKESTAPKASEMPKESEAPKASEMPKKSEVPKNSPTPVSTTAPAASPKPVSSPTPKPTTSPQQEASSTVSIEIKSGESSTTVCRKLEEAGLIASAADFDMFLYQHGYDKKMKVGVHEIPVGAEPETIAELLTF